MLVRALSGAVVLLVISCVTAMPPREQRQLGFFSPTWGLPDYAESSEESGSNPDYSDYSSFSAMMHGLQTKMIQMRQQLEDAMKQFPRPSVPRPFKPSDIGFDESKPTNSSSTVKVINGHKVTVNETTYKSGDNGGSAVFHVRIVDISPHDDKDKSTETVEPEVPGVAMDETVEEQAKSEEAASTEAPQETPTPSAENNEIPQTREGRLLTDSDWQLQDRPFPPRAPALQMRAPNWASEYLPQWPAIPNLASKWRLKGLIEKPDMEAELRGYKPDSDVEMVPWVPMKPIDLGSDLRVNQLLSEREQAGGLVMPDPDSEFVELQDGKLVPNIQSA